MKYEDIDVALSFFNALEGENNKINILVAYQADVHLVKRYIFDKLGEPDCVVSNRIKYKGKYISILALSLGIERLRGLDPQYIFYIGRVSGNDQELLDKLDIEPSDYPVRYYEEKDDNNGR